jgi:hypothetical protein
VKSNKGLGFERQRNKEEEGSFSRGFNVALDDFFLLWSSVEQSTYISTEGCREAKHVSRLVRLSREGRR